MALSLCGQPAPFRTQSEPSLTSPAVCAKSSISEGHLPSLETPMSFVEGPSLVISGPSASDLPSMTLAPASEDTMPGQEVAAEEDGLDFNENVERITSVVGIGSQFIPIGGDFVAFGASLVNLAVNPSWSNVLDVGLDAVGVLPAVPALGSVRRAARLADALDCGLDVKKGVKVAKAAKSCWELGW